MRRGDTGRNLTTVPARKLRVLVAEGEGGEIARILESIFSSGGDSLELTRVSREDLLKPTIQLVAPEMIFVDAELFPNEPLGEIRALRRMARKIPLILHWRGADREIAEQSLQEGATDYLLMGEPDNGALERVVRNALEQNTFAGLTELLRDPETDVYSWEGLLALTKRAVHAAQKSSRQLVVLHAGLENFAVLREEFGPSTAEKAIKDVGALLRSVFRSTDVVARSGEADFAVLALGAVEPSAEAMVQRVKKRLETLNQGRAAWGSLVLRVSARFWSIRDKAPSPELLLANEVAISQGSGDAEATLRSETP